MEIRQEVLYLNKTLTRDSVPAIYSELERRSGGRVLAVDLASIEFVDSAGVALLETIRSASGVPADSFYQGGTEEVRKSIELFTLPPPDNEAEKSGFAFFTSAGEKGYALLIKTRQFILLSSNILFWSITDIFRFRYRRRGEVAKQTILIGLDAVPIVVLLSVIIGLIIALQSAAQLRQFGAGIFVVDLISISMVREMGPMITSILIAGRSGSAIAAEIATMKVTEELDALKIMALEPVRFVLVPKALAISVCLPLLVGVSIMVGISAGMLVSRLYLNISFLTFVNQVFEVLTVNDLAVGLGKSFFFGWIIMFVASFCGMSTSGGAEGVGAATTRSVVGSIFGVIALDALFSFSYMV